jgi:hypothetical protein
MIRFSFGIANWRKPCEFRNIYNRAWTVSRNRTLEIQFDHYDYELLGLSFDLRWQGQSHAGPDFELNILGWCFRIGLPDNRHWDYKNNSWETADPTEAEHV